MNDLTGKRFGRWLALKHDGSKCWHHRWLCKCDCGTIRSVLGHHLIATTKLWKSLSCGCLRNERTSAANTKHGQYKTKTYKIWKLIRERCFGRNNPRYKHYGGRGIGICRRWQKFENFLADMGERPPGLSIERINNDLGYCKSNCKWGTAFDQANNKRSNVRLRFMGRIQTVAQWSRAIGISAPNIRRRITLGWKTARILTEPVNRCVRRN